MFDTDSTAADLYRRDRTIDARSAGSGVTDA
jgi:hypothetical protein